MNQKIDSTHEEFSTTKEEFTHGFFPSLILLTLIILIGAVTSENQGDWFYRDASKAFPNVPPLFTLSPSMYASYTTTINGLRAFSGNVPILPHLILKIGMLASIIVTYITIPTVFFFIWRRRRIENKSIFSSSPLSASSVCYALSIIFTVSIAVTSMRSSISGYLIRQGIEQEQAIQLDQYEILYDMDSIAFDAYRYKLIPKEFGGGGGKYTGFVVDPERAKTKNGTYTVTINEQKMEIHGHSLLYPASIIRTLKVSENGQIGFW